MIKPKFGKLKSIGQIYPVTRFCMVLYEQFLHVSMIRVFPLHKNCVPSHLMGTRQHENGRGCGDCCLSELGEPRVIHKGLKVAARERTPPWCMTPFPKSY